MRKVLVIGVEDNFNSYNFYKIGFDDYAHKNNLIIDYFYLGGVIYSGFADYAYRKLYPNKYQQKQTADLKKKFLEIIEKKKYDDFIFINLPLSAKAIIKQFSKELQGKSIVLFVDTMKGFAPFNEGNIFRQIYSFEYSDIEYAKNKYGISVKYCPLGATYHLFDTQNDELIYDVSFVCRATPERLQYLNAIAKYCYENNRKLYLAGHFWHNNHAIQYFIGKCKFRIKYPILYRYVANKYVSSKELAQIYKNSKILLNINISKHSSFNQRNFNIMISDRILITDKEKLEGIDAIPGRDFIMADGIDDMVTKIDYYLNNEEARNIIAKNGMKITKSKYLFSNTIDALLTK